MKLKDLRRAMEDFAEVPVPAAVVDNVSPTVVEPQAVMAPAVIGAITPESPIVVPTPLPTIEEPLPEEVAVVPVEGTLPVGEEPAVPFTGEAGFILEPVVDHDDTMAMMDQLQTEEVTGVQAIDDIIEIQTGLEDYLKLLRKAGPDGVSRQTAGIIRIDLQSFQDKAKGKVDLSDLINSMEDMGDGEKDHILPSKIKSTSFASKVATVAKAFWEWLKKVYTKGKEFATQVTQGVTLADVRLKKLEASISSSHEPGGDFKVPSAGNIAIGTDVPLQVPTNLVQLAQWAAVTQPKGIATGYKTLAGEIDRFDLGNEDVSKVEADMRIAIAKNYITLDMSSKGYPGNFMLYSKEDSEVTGIKPDDQPEIGEVTAERRSMGTIKGNIKLLTGILSDLKAYSANYQGVADGAELVAGALDKLEAKAGSENMDKSAADDAAELARKVNVYVHKTTPNSNEIVRYVVRTVNAYIDVIAAETAGAK